MAIKIECDRCGHQQILIQRAEIPSMWSKVSLDPGNNSGQKSWVLCASCTSVIENTLNKVVLPG